MEQIISPIIALIKRNCIICRKEMMIDITKKESEDWEREAIHLKCIKFFDGSRQELHGLKKI